MKRRWVILLLALVTISCGDESGGGSNQPEVQAGIAEVRMPAPVGIGTVGYFGISVEAEPSPFSRRYPATTRAHGYPTFRAVVLSKGPGQEVVFLRADLVGVFQQFRRAVVLTAEQRLGRSIDNAVIVGATHTHSGPGRILDGGGVYDLIADAFFPEFYERMVDAAATAIVEAFGNLAPARVGHTWVQSASGHSDRRCEDGRDYTNDAIPVIAIERGGKVDAVVFAYAVHSTGLGIEELTLSRDVAGAMEEQLEGRFDHPVMALFLNSWAADMSPGNPQVPLQTGAAQPDGYERIDKVGWTVADSVYQGLPSITWESSPEIFAEIHRVPINRTAIGYGPGEFPFEWGGVYCGGLGETDCDPSTIASGIDKRCVPFPQNYPVPPQTELSAGRIGSLAFVTFPGEPGTLLAEKLLGQLRDQYGQSNVMLVGYAQDYTGYSVLEDDWWQGGYEAAGAIWGPRQGEYLVTQANRIFERTLVSRSGQDPAAPGPLAPFDIDGYTPYVPAGGEQVGTVAAEVAASYGSDDIVTFTVRGSDPWLGTPTATLTDAQGQPIQRAGRPVTSAGYGFWVDLQPRPGYRENRNAVTRTFLWTFSMPTRQVVPGVVPELIGGTYRLAVSLPTADGAVEARSAAFTIE